MKPTITPKCKICTALLKITGYTINSWMTYCTKCSIHSEVPMTAAEKKERKFELRLQNKEIMFMHAEWYAFTKQFKSGHSEYKWQGYELMQHVDNFIKKHKTIKVVSCDDSGHAGSYLVLIPHMQSNGKNWGTTVVYIPQCFGHPQEFFLYPDHNKSLTKALKELI